MNVRLIAILILVSFASSYSKDNSEEKLKNDLAKKYGDLKSLSAVVFNSETGMKGEITAAKGNKYNVKTNTLQMISDGKTVWNFVKAENKVNINNVSSFQSKFSLDVIFFTFIHDFRTESVEKNDKGYVLELIMKEPIDMLDKVVLFINDKTLDIYRLKIISYQTTTTWDISKLKLNPKLSKNAFSFEIPKDAEVIDLR